jgi:uncharacterized protein (UPF0212 family)
MRRVLLGLSGFALLVAILVAATSSRAQEPKVEEGFTSLFNGKDLTGWRYTKTPKDLLEGKTTTTDGRIEVKDGVILMNEKDDKGKGGTFDLYTIKDFAKDFILRLEFRAAPKADSGVYIRGNQLQVRDYPTVGPYKPKSFKKGEWNDLEIIVRAKVLVAKVNGKALTDADALELSVKNGAHSVKLNGKDIDVSKVDISYGPAAECKCNGEVIEKAFAVPAKGGIGLQAESGKFEFRNVRVKELN